jgi:hypothetical protein
VSPETPEAGTGQLVSGILSDAKTLLEQQVQLFRSELKHELRQLRTGLVSVCIGGGFAAVGVLFLLAMAVHLLAAKTQIPLWGCYGIVGGAVTAVGLGFLFGGRKSVSGVELAPPPVTAQALKENVEWLKSLKHRKTVEPAA